MVGLLKSSGASGFILLIARTIRVTKVKHRRCKSPRHCFSQCFSSRSLLRWAQVNRFCRRLLLIQTGGKLCGWGVKDRVLHGGNSRNFYFYKDACQVSISLLYWGLLTGRRWAPQASRLFLREGQTTAELSTILAFPSPVSVRDSLLPFSSSNMRDPVNHDMVIFLIQVAWNGLKVASSAKSTSICDLSGVYHSFKNDFLFKHGIQWRNLRSSGLEITTSICAGWIPGEFFYLF